ncbi:CusA/CzcA family heavy metal efflux RND transporter [Fibrella sp. USSR17]
MLQKIIQFSVHQKLMVALGVVALIAWGSYALRQLPIDAIPDITNNQVQVITQVPSLAAQETEQFVTFPLESTLRNVPGVTEIRSISRFGLSVITVVFDDETPTFQARQLVTEQLKAAEAELTAGTPQLAPITTGLGEIYQYVIRPKDGFETKYSATDLRTVQDWIVKRQLAGVPGVVEVSSLGGYLKEYEVQIDPERLRGMNTTLTEVVDALSANNANTGGSYIEKGPEAFFIRGEGTVKTPTEIGQIVVRNEGPTPILVRDVARVDIGHAVRYGAMTRNGHGEVVGGIVLMLKGASSEKTIEGVKTRIAEIQKSLPAGLTIEPFLDRKVLIDKAIHTVAKNLLEGGLIVMAVLLLLLGNWRAGLVVASVIPLCMLFALGMMHVFGVSANLMSLGAIDFGLLVDGAVIIVESMIFQIVHTQAARTQSMDEIALDSSNRLMRSALFGQLIILIVYVPILSLTGIEGKMFRPMALTVGFAIVGAMLLCVTYVPMMAATLLRKDIKEEGTLADRIMKFLYRLYAPLLNGALRWRKTVLAASVALLGGAVWLFTTMGGEFIPNLDEGDIAISLTLKPGSSLSQTVETTRRIETILKNGFPEVNQVISKIGTAEIPTDPMPIEAADVMVLLKEPGDWTTAKTKEELIQKMERALSVLPGLNLEFTQPIQLRFNELMTGVKSDIAVKIYGEDLGTLFTKANQAAAKLKAIPGVGDLKVEQISGLPQMLVSYNRVRLAQYGVSVAGLNRILKTAFAGETAGVVFEGEKRFDLVVRLDSTYRQDIDNIRQLYVDLPNGQQVPLEQLATIRYQDAPMQISRDNARRRITIGINVRGRDVESLVGEMKAVLEKDVPLPAGYSYTFGGQFENLVKAKERLGVAVPLALVLIGLLLFFTFGSFSQALMIFTAIPLSAIGGVLALWLRGMPFSISAGVGFIALFGIAVLNGIVLISYFNQLESEGVTNVLERVKQGTAVRFRPVVMTAAVASMGFLPMALSTSAGAEVQKPLATVVIGGLVSATLLTLVVLPLLYSLVAARTRKTQHIMTPNLAQTLTALLLVAGLSGCSSAPEKAKETQSASPKAAGTVTISEAQFRETGIQLGGPDTLTLGETIQATGKLEAPPDQWAIISAPMGGFVRSAKLVEGDFVRKGQVLAVLEHPDYVKLQQEYLQAIARNQFERQELERQTELSREEFGAKRKLQQSTADVESTRALLTSLEAQLAQLHIPLELLRKGHISRTIPLLAPISGYVDKVNLRLGQFVGTTDMLVEIVGKEHLYLELRVFESDIRQIREGQQVRFTVPQQQTGEMKATVYRVGQAFDAQTKTVLVHANLTAGQYDRLFAGSYVRATILASPRQVVALPDDALVKDGNQTFVYVREPGSASGTYRFGMVPIRTGITQNHRTEVTLPATLNPATIVRQGAYFISAERVKTAG